MIHEQDLLGRISDLGGLKAPDASLAARATLAALGERIEYEKRSVITRELPDELATIFRARKYRGTFGLTEFFARVRSREKVSLGFAREHAEVVCRVLGELLSEAATHTLDRVLPEPFAALFRTPNPGESPADYRVARSARHHTLATGAPGSLHPVSESRPRDASGHSVAERNPHGETKLSSATGLTQERLDQSLATAKPDERRKISGASD